MWSQVPTMVHAQENSARQYTLIAGGDGSVRASELRRKCWILYIYSISYYIYVYIYSIDM